MRAWRVIVLPLLPPLLAVACALPPWVHGAPRFPDNDGVSWELPLYEPLTQVGPHVVGTFCGAATRDHASPCEEVVLFVDSGSSHSALRQATFDHLRIATTASRLATIEDAGGELPKCPDPGCVSAAPVAPGDRAARVHLRIAASFSRPMRFLFACSDGHGGVDRFPLWLEISVRRPTAGTETETAPEGSDAVRQLWGSHCTRLTLIDVSPVIESVRPLGADVESRLALDARNAHLE
jgi:hypothetical protein